MKTIILPSPLTSSGEWLRHRKHACSITFPRISRTRPNQPGHRAIFLIYMWYSVLGVWDFPRLIYWHCGPPPIGSRKWLEISRQLCNGIDHLAPGFSLTQGIQQLCHIFYFSSDFPAIHISVIFPSVSLFTLLFSPNPAGISNLTFHRALEGQTRLNAGFETLKCTGRALFFALRWAMMWQILTHSWYSPRTFPVSFILLACIKHALNARAVSALVDCAFCTGHEWVLVYHPHGFNALACLELLIWNLLLLKYTDFGEEGTKLTMIKENAAKKKKVASNTKQTD